MIFYDFGPEVQFNHVELDKIFQDAFDCKKGGTFVEVGAYDGKTYSHTYGLAMLGWRGVYVEPVPELSERCIANHKDHPNVTVCQCAAGRFNLPATLHIDENSVCGSTLALDVCKDPKEITVPVRTLDSILEENEINPSFDLLSIDVEFGEMEVLTGFTLGRWMPKMIIIELCEHHPEPKHTWAKPARDYCEKEFPQLGYRKIYSDCLNNIYVHL